MELCSPSLSCCTGHSQEGGMLSGRALAEGQAEHWQTPLGVTHVTSCHNSCTLSMTTWNSSLELAL